MGGEAKGCFTPEGAKQEVPPVRSSRKTEIKTPEGALIEPDILRCIETLDKRSTKAEAGAVGGRSDRKQTPEGASLEPAAAPVRSSRKTAEMLGISPRQVERARTIIDHAPEELKEALAHAPGASISCMTQPA